MSSNVEKIKERLDIVDVVSSYIKVQKAGKNFKAKCPFHNEKTPSFFVSPERDSFYCFGCGRGGDIFTFVEEFEGLEFFGALKVLADKAGIDLEYEKDNESKEEKDTLRDIIKAALKYFAEELKKNDEVLNYLKDRGLKEGTVENFKLGFAPKGWHNLHHKLKDKYSEKLLMDAGLVKRSKGKIYDVFRERLIFPIFDSAGREVAFTGRVFGENDSDAKYINSPETKIYQKSKILYGYDKAKFSIRKNDFAILVEGNMDVIMAHQAGYTNTVAVSGTSLTENHLKQIRRLTDKIVFAFDSDSGGIRASSRGAKLALSMGIDLKVATLPKGSDPADTIKKDKNEWKKRIKGAEHIVNFLLRKIEGETSEQRKFGLKVREEVLPYVIMIDNKIDQDHFLKEIAQKIDVSENALRQEMEKIDINDLETLSEENGGKTKKEEILSRKREIEKRLAGIFFWKDGKNKFTKQLNEANKIIGEDLLKKYSTHKNKLATVAEISYEGGSEINKEVEELLLNLKEDYLRHQIGLKIASIKNAEEDGDENRLEELLKDYQKLQLKLEDIKEKRT